MTDSHNPQALLRDAAECRRVMRECVAAENWDAAIRAEAAAVSREHAAQAITAADDAEIAEWERELVDESDDGDGDE